MNLWVDWWDNHQPKEDIMGFVVKLVLTCVLGFGAAVLLSHLFPSSTHIAFTVGEYGISWLLLGTCAVGAVGLKVML